MKRRRSRPAKRAAKRKREAPRVHASQPAASERHPRIGLEATLEKVVPHEWTIQSFNPHLPAVFSTPSMIGLMEHATVEAIVRDLPPGAISVGTRVEVDHLKAVPAGALVRAWAKLVEYRGRFLVFDVEARAGEHLIGRGRVFRAIVPRDGHDAKAKARI
jgi:fluoroacetyl-CoA thioesterase